MWSYVYELKYFLIRTVNRMEMHEWFIVFAVVVVAGAICLRGFGSRTDY